MELAFEFAWNFLFCVAIAFLNLRLSTYKWNVFLKILALIISNVFLLLFADVIGSAVQKKIFLNATPDVIFRTGYTLRLFASLVLMSLTVKMILLIRASKLKDNENAELKNAYLNVQLELLKEELNPHFFFNTLSSLSAIVHEDPKQAQHYISHLSKIFRYTLNRQEKNLVPLQEELTVLDSYTVLMKMRLEDALCIDIDIPQSALHNKLAYMSLQPLLENAVKHNAASTANPLVVRVYTDNGKLVFKNNLQPVHFNEESTGIGLANLSERFRILLHKEIEIEKTAKDFIVKLPLLQA